MNSGDAGSIVKSLYVEWYPSLVSYAARARVESANGAEDVVQEAFLALYRELVRGGSVHSLKGWTICVLRRQIIKSRRQEMRQRDACSALSYLTAAGAANSQGYREIDLERFLSVLTRREAEILRMRAAPMRYAEIAGSLGISANTVKTLLARAIRKMQEAARQKHPECWRPLKTPAVPLVPASSASSHRMASRCWSSDSAIGGR
jgi:RNA polymerase sigma factor (sigma-70 family)